MTRRMVCLILSITMFSWSLSCTKVVQVGPGKVADSKLRVVSVVYPGGRSITFKDSQGQYNPFTRIISGQDESGASQKASVDEISYAYVRKSDAVGTTFLVIGIIALALVAAAGIVVAESCPFVYSWDGTQYVFDAEPFGGAICAGLYRTDYGRLDHVQETDGHYRLMLRNEVPETQYNDEMTILAIDHRPGTVIVPDYDGQFVQLGSLNEPLTAVDEHGSDISAFVEQSDQFSWQSDLPRSTDFTEDDLVDTLTFEFHRPAGADHATLVLNGGTGLWGSHMIREMLELRGDQVDVWYDAVNHGRQEILDLHQWNMREQLYLLNLYVQEGDAWVSKHTVYGGGPYLTEDRYFDIPLQDVTGDRLRIQVRPTKGYWSFDYIGVDYGSHDKPTVIEVPLQHAEDHAGNDITASLLRSDSTYYVQPTTDDWAELIYVAPPKDPTLERTLYLRASGYYEIHLEKEQPEQTELIASLMTTQDLIKRWSLERYVAWRNRLLAQTP